MTRSTWGWLAIGTIALLAGPQAAQGEDRLPHKMQVAFRDVVAAPASSTVRVFSDGYSAALGAIVDPGGYIVTKASELRGKIECQLNEPGGKKYAASVVGRNKDLDLAVLKIERTNLPAIAWSAGDAPPVGSWLVTPGLSNMPLAVGVLSVSPRRIRPPPAALGIDLSGQLKPARISGIIDGSPADKAGLQTGDIVLKVDGKEVPDSQSLIDLVTSYQPGDEVELLLQRGDKELTKKAVLGSKAKVFDMEDDRAEFQNSLGGQLSQRRYGFPSVIQHDSVLKPEECGGPIVDLDGKAVGINIARAGRVESYALPAGLVKDAVKKVLETHQTSASVER